MKLTNHISLTASGDNGFSMTHPLDCNVYVVDAGEGLIMIDAGAGMDGPAIERELQNDGYRVQDIRYLVVTHAHADHAVGAPYFLEKSKARLVTSAYEGHILGQPTLLENTMKEYVAAGFYPPGYRFPGMEADLLLEDGDCLELGNICLQALVLPGHTGGGLCLYGNIDGREVLFSGDTVLFDGKINLMSIFDGDLLAYKDSILRLEKLPVDMLLPGHLQPVLSRGSAPICKAAGIFRRFGVPPSIC